MNVAFYPPRKLRVDQRGVAAAMNDIAPHCTSLTESGVVGFWRMGGDDGISMTGHSVRFRGFRLLGVTPTR